MKTSNKFNCSMKINMQEQFNILIDNLIFKIVHIFNEDFFRSYHGLEISRSIYFQFVSDMFSKLDQANNACVYLIRKRNQFLWCH